MFGKVGLCSSNSDTTDVPSYFIKIAKNRTEKQEKVRLLF